MEMVRARKMPFSNLALILSTFLSFCLWSNAAGAAKINVFLSHQAKPYEETLEGFKYYILKQLPEAKIEVFYLDQGPTATDKSIQNYKANDAEVILTLGSVATRELISVAGTAPIVAGLLLYDDIISKASNVTCVFMDFPFQVQFEWIKRLLPSRKNIGVLYNPEENQQKIEFARQAAQDAGLKLEFLKVEAPRDLPVALRTLAKKVDALFGIPDKMLV